jgi:hypothetical protein
MSKSCLFVLSAASNESFWEAFIPSISSSMSLSELEVLGDLFVVDITDLLTDSLLLMICVVIPLMLIVVHNYTQRQHIRIRWGEVFF